MSDSTVKRPYSSVLRDEQSAATRVRVIDAARGLFVGRGYTATSMNDVARAAGVSRETVHKIFGTKPGLMKTVYDVALAGDADEVPVAERPEFQAMLHDPDPRSAFRTFGRLSAELVDRLGPVMAVVLAGARAGDADLRVIAATSEQERMTGVRLILTRVTASSGLRDGVDLDTAVDVVWTLTSPEVWQLLVDGRGWSVDRYGGWLSTAVADAVLPPDA
jgi:AcrR family transcriptional regulator